MKRGGGKKKGLHACSAPSVGFKALFVLQLLLVMQILRARVSRLRARDLYFPLVKTPAEASAQLSQGSLLSHQPRRRGSVKIFKPQLPHVSSFTLRKEKKKLHLCFIEQTQSSKSKKDLNSLPVTSPPAADPFSGFWFCFNKVRPLRQRQPFDPDPYRFSSTGVCVQNGQ